MVRGVRIGGESARGGALALAAAGALIALLATSACTAVRRPETVPPSLILVSFDGFRWDFIDRVPTPALDRLVASGVRAERLIPSFPTKTFPNHYTVVTGLYPGHHGIISNNIRDPELDDRFSLGNRDAVQDPRWWHGEPIWVTARNQGRVAAPYFWPGSEAPIGGTHAAYWQRYDGSMPHEERVDRVLAAGPIPMMEAVAETTRPYGIPTVASLNPIMVDGTGMCGGCRVSVGGTNRFACLDGPDFDAHAVDFTLLAQRNRAYAEWEAERREQAEECRAVAVEPPS